MNSVRRKETEIDDNSGKKALAVGGATAMNGLGGGYSAYKGAKDKENGENHVGRHMLGHGAVVGAGTGLVAAHSIKKDIRASRTGKDVRSLNPFRRIGAKKSLSAMKKRGNKAALIATGLGGAIGAAAGGASYGAGRAATTKNKTKKD